MPRGKRLSKKIHDKKKSNPKRSIRKPKKGGGLIKTKISRDDVDKLINDMENVLDNILTSYKNKEQTEFDNDISLGVSKRNDIKQNIISIQDIKNAIKNGSSAEEIKQMKVHSLYNTNFINLGVDLFMDDDLNYNERLKKQKNRNYISGLMNRKCEYNIINQNDINNIINQATNIVGYSVLKIRSGVEPCSSQNNENTQQYYECEAKKINQYKTLYELLYIYYRLFYSCDSSTRIPIFNKDIYTRYYITFSDLAHRAKLLMEKHENKLKKLGQYEEYYTRYYENYGQYVDPVDPDDPNRNEKNYDDLENAVSNAKSILDNLKKEIKDYSNNNNIIFAENAIVESLISPNKGPISNLKENIDNLIKEIDSVVGGDMFNIQKNISCLATDIDCKTIINLYTEIQSLCSEFSKELSFTNLRAKFMGKYYHVIFSNLSVKAEKEKVFYEKQTNKDNTEDVPSASPETPEKKSNNDDYSLITGHELYNNFITEDNFSTVGVDYYSEPNGNKRLGKIVSNHETTNDYTTNYILSFKDINKSEDKIVYSTENGNVIKNLDLYYLNPNTDISAKYEQEQAKQKYEIIKKEEEKEKEEKKNFLDNHTYLRQYTYPNQQNHRFIEHVTKYVYRDEQGNEVESYYPPTQKMKYAAAANQPGGKRRSRKKRNMKKSKKGKSKNRR